MKITLSDIDYPTEVAQAIDLLAAIEGHSVRSGDTEPQPKLCECAPVPMGGQHILQPTLQDAITDWNPTHNTTTAQAGVEQPARRPRGRPKKQTKADIAEGVANLSSVSQAADSTMLFDESTEDAFSTAEVFDIGAVLDELEAEADTQQEVELLEDPQGDDLEHDVVLEYLDTGAVDAESSAEVSMNVTMGDSDIDPDLAAFFNDTPEVVAEPAHNTGPANPYSGWLHDQLLKEMNTRMLNPNGLGGKWYLAKFREFGVSGIKALTDDMMREVLAAADAAK